MVGILSVPAVWSASCDRKGWWIFLYATELFWILVLSAIFSKLTLENDKKINIIFERKIHGKYAINFVIHVGKGADKTVDIEGKCHWHE